MKNWIQLYKLDELKKEIYDFISFSSGLYENQSLSQKIQVKRENRISYLLDKEKNKPEPLEYLNQFLNDFSEQIGFLSQPIGQFMYLDDSGDDSQLRTQNIFVSSYEFDDYNEVKIWLNMMLFNNKFYVFSYTLRPQPTLVTNKQKFTHVIRGFFVSDDDIKKWILESNTTNQTIYDTH